MTMNLVQWPDEYDANITTRIVDGIGEMPSEWKMYFDVQPTTKYIEQTAGYSGFGRMGEWKDDEDLPLDTPSDIYDNSITQAFYGMGFAISRKAVQYGLSPRKYNKWAQALVLSLADLYGYKHADILNGGFTDTWSSLGNVALFSASHTSEGGATRSNINASAALTPANLEVLIVQGLNMTDFRGKRARMMYNKLIIPPALRRTASQILQSAGESGTANNDINTQRGMFEIVVDPFLTDGSTTAYFVQAPNHGLISLHGQAPLPERYMAPSAKRLVHGLSADFATSVEQWEGMAASQGA